MLASRLQPSQHGLLRSNLQLLLRCIDSASVIAIGGTAEIIANSAKSHPNLLTTWAVAAWAAWALTRPNQAVLVLDQYYRAITAPFLALVITLVASAAARQPLSFRFLLTVTLGWIATMLIARLVVRRFAPPVTLGVLPGVQTCGTSDRRVQYVHLHTVSATVLRDYDALLVNPGATYQEDWHHLVMHAQVAGVPIWTQADLAEEMSGQISLEFLHEHRLNPKYYRSGYMRAKRALDMAATILALPFLLPLMAVVAILVLIDTGRPILFWQERVGQGGDTFRLVKFRTMRRDSERNGAAFATNGDPRITRLGGLLRKFRLDELPQFWNVLRGDMSIIGPRPEQRGFVDQFEQDLHLYRMRHWVKPGITGWAQVTHGYAAGADETRQKLRYDAYYIKHLSFWLDARIVVRTIATILTGFGAR